MFILKSASLAGTAVNTLPSASFSSGIEALMLAQASNAQAEFALVMRQLAEIAVSTHKIDALSEVAAGASGLYFVAVDQGGVANGTGLSIVGGATCLAIPERISWQAGQPATLEAKVMFLSANGSTSPITVGSAAGDETAASAFWVGHGTGISAIEIDFGYKINTPPDGHLYPIDAYIEKHNPIIKITTDQNADFGNTAAISPGTIGSLTATLKAVADGGVRGASKTFTCTGLITRQSIAGGNPAKVVYQCQAKGGITIG